MNHNSIVQTRAPSDQAWPSRLLHAREPRAGSAVLVRRSWVCQWSEGARATPPDSGLNRGLQSLLMAWSSAICADTDERVISLTFDDGPDPRFTPSVLDVLQQEGVKATFFMLSSAAQRYPGIVQRAIDDGHEIALHGVDHERTTGWSRKESVAMLRRGQSELEDVAQRRVKLYRPTYGAQRIGLVRAARRLALETVIWSGWAQDWRGDDPQSVVDRAYAACHPGGILLLHDTLAGLAPGDNPSIYSPEVTTRLLVRLSREDWRILPAGALLDNYRQVRSAWFERPGTERN